MEDLFSQYDKIINDLFELCKLYIQKNKIEELCSYIENFTKTFYSDYMLRSKFISTITYAIPNFIILNKIINFTENDFILEIGAGNGYTSTLLNNIGFTKINITDNHSEKWFKSQYNFCEIEKIDAIDAVKKYNSHNVLMCLWLTNDDIAYKSLIEFKGNKLIYCGESEYGFNADNQFFSELETNWEIDEIINNPKFLDTNDCFYFYIKKK